MLTSFLQFDRGSCGLELVGLGCSHLDGLLNRCHCGIGRLHLITVGGFPGGEQAGAVELVGKMLLLELGHLCLGDLPALGLAELLVGVWRNEYVLLNERQSARVIDGQLLGGQAVWGLEDQTLACGEQAQITNRRQAHLLRERMHDSR